MINLAKSNNQRADTTTAPFALINITNNTMDINKSTCFYAVRQGRNPGIYYDW